MGVVLCVSLTVLVLVFPSCSGPGRGEGIELEITGQESPDELANHLSSLGLVAHPTLFSTYLRTTGAIASMPRGTHVVTTDVSPRELIARLTRSASRRMIRVTFPEGFNRFDMAKRFQEKHICSLRTFLQATTNSTLLKELGIEGESAEGYLFPSTYDFPANSDGAEIVRRMKLEFDRRVAQLEEKQKLGVSELAQSLGFKRPQIVVLASIVEKEAAVDDERATIASVFLNRLRDPDFRPKLLQSDPTSGYGCLTAPDKAPSCAGFTGRITPAMNQDGGNRYSTYKYEGLPPGPICNPGARSLEAVLSPAKTRFLYFVAKGGGRHTFSETYAAHLEAIGGRK